MRRVILIAALWAVPCLAAAQVSSLAAPMDVEAVTAAIAAAVPQPADTLPPTEAVTPTAGAAPTYRRSDAVPVRITRATTVTTTTGGTFSGTWSTPLSAAPAIVMTPIAANASIDCQLTAAPTTTAFQGRCWTSQTTLLNLSLVTSGLTVSPTVNTAAGIQVQIVAIPPTQ